MGKKPLALSVRILLFNPERQVLLLQRSKRSKTNPGKWELPGGKIDPGESFDSALNREIMEETGLIVRILHAAGTAEQQVPGWHVIHLVMTGEIVSGTVSISDEHEEFRWVPKKDLAHYELADWCADYVAQMARINVLGV
jgi:8-oxo-dGTP diphosphatase